MVAFCLIRIASPINHRDDGDYHSRVFPEWSIPDSLEVMGSLEFSVQAITMSELPNSEKYFFPLTPRTRFSGWNYFGVKAGRNGVLPFGNNWAFRRSKPTAEERFLSLSGYTEQEFSLDYSDFASTA